MSLVTFNAQPPMRGPIVVLEAETGSGKTEAALWRFATLFATGQVDGLYFALPARVAASQIHGRVQRAMRWFQVCSRFVALCRTIGLFVAAGVAIDGSKFKAVNNRDKNFTRAKMQRRRAQIEESVARYLHQLDSADRQEPSEALKTKTSRLKEKIAKLKEEMQRLEALGVRMLATPD
jgi:gas vesicle protein